MAKKKRPGAKRADKDPSPLESLPDRRAMEKIMRQFAAGLGGQSGGDTPLDRAQEIMYRAFEATPGEQVRLARQALKISPDCADAYALLAEHAKSADEAQELLEQGVAAGERAIGKKGFAECEGHFWGVLETRPYMRAKQGLAQCLWDTGRREEAAKHYQEMLQLNPSDNQGVRYSLATLLLDLDRDNDLRQLLADYKDDASAEWAYANALVAFRKGGESTQSNKLLMRAVNVNKHVPAYLLGHTQLPQASPPYITRGGEDEAICYAQGNRRAWMNTPGAISWARKILDLPMPTAPKSRRPPWPKMKVALLRCPQERGEIWQIDVMPFSPGSQSISEEEAPWAVIFVARASREILKIEGFAGEPKPSDVWEHVTDLIRRPGDSDPYPEPCRPAVIEVRKKAFHTAWKTKLKQVGIECVLSDTLDELDELRSHLPSINLDSDANEQDLAIGPEELLALPIEPGEVWQAEIRLMPTWITGEGTPYRPWISLVVSQTDDLVLAHQIATDRPEAEWLEKSILQAIWQPVIGEPHRPDVVEVNSIKQQKALMPYLDRIGIECVVVDPLENLDSAFDSMIQHFVGQGGPPSITEAPGMKLEQVGKFYMAADEFYRRKPWLRVPGDTIIKVECDKFQSGPWYVVVMGQSGMEQGLAIYEDLVSLQNLIAGKISEAKSARKMSSLSLMFGEPFDISTRDLDLAEKHGWPVAGPEAYPLVIRINPGPAVRSPLTWELELLEDCLRTIPDFLAKKETGSKVVEVASGTSAMRLSWIARSTR